MQTKNIRHKPKGPFQPMLMQNLCHPLIFPEMHDDRLAVVLPRATISRELILVARKYEIYLEYML
jgi:hypothetical protein